MIPGLRTFLAGSHSLCLCHDSIPMRLLHKMGSLFLVSHLLHSNFTKEGRKGKICFPCIKSFTVGFHWLWLCHRLLFSHDQTWVQSPSLETRIGSPGFYSEKGQYWANVWQEMKSYPAHGICLTIGPVTLLWRFGYGQFTEWKSKLLLPYRKGITQGWKWKECLLHVYLHKQRPRIWLGHHQTSFLIRDASFHNLLSISNLWMIEEKQSERAQ